VNEAANSPPEKFDFSANAGNCAARKNYYLRANTNRGTSTTQLKRNEALCKADWR